MMKTLTQKVKCETLCALTVEKEEELIDTALKVTTTPFEIGNELFVLIFLQDVSREQEWQALEQLFFHDFNNILGGMIGASELLQDDPTDKESLNIILDLSWRMKREIDVQRVLFQKSSGEYELANVEISVDSLFKELQNIITTNHNSEGKEIVYSHNEISIISDKTLLLRILLNMTLNALEAITTGKEVSVSCERNESTTTFSVWNESVIPPEYQKRVFQRHFSTKAFVGRGLGSYSIKLFGERYLGGKVWFSSTKDEGTTFYFSIPLGDNNTPCPSDQKR